MNKLSDQYILTRCSQCGEMFTKENMIEYETVWVCAACKPVFLQKIKEGVESIPKAANIIGWKIFFFVIFALYLSSFKFSVQSILEAERLFFSILDIAIGPFVIVSLFGFAFKKKIWNRMIWKILFPIAIFQDISANVFLFFQKTSFEYKCTIIAVFFAFSPVYIFKYIGLYRYAFSKRKPWL